MEQKIPRPEYPRPQFVRKDWMNLNGEWEFEQDPGVSGKERQIYERELKERILVPFCPESDLSGIGNKDFMACVWYRRKVEIPREWAGKRVLLHFGACDYRTTVYVNGREAGVHVGGYTSFSFDITELLTEGENLIAVCAEDDVRSRQQPAGKQSILYHSHVCYYTRTTGIWQTVWLEAVPEAYIRKIWYDPDVDNCCLHIRAQVAGKGCLSAEAFYEGKSMGSAEARSCGEMVHLTVPLSEEHLWEVGCGRLYDLKLRFGEDTAEGYFGLRKAEMDGKYFRLNGRIVFQRLVLDQGFYPDGIYTAPSEEALIRDIELSLEAGFNGARLHQKVFEPRFLYHCDRMGYLVWGEQASWVLDLSRPGALSWFLPEWIEAVERDYNHPAIIGWCPFNETWDTDGRKQIDSTLQIVYEVTKALDPARPCIDTSGNFHVKTDIFDVHDYEQNPDIFRANYDRLMTEGVLVDRFSDRQKYSGEPVFVSEYGGIKWDVERTIATWGYGSDPETEEEYMDRYERLTTALMENDQMFGFCYTQLYDVEQEKNGIYTYDRKKKFDLERIRKTNQQIAACEKMEQK